MAVIVSDAAATRVLSGPGKTASLHAMRIQQSRYRTDPRPWLPSWPPAARWCVRRTRSRSRPNSTMRIVFSETKICAKTHCFVIGGRITVHVKAISRRPGGTDIGQLTNTGRLLLGKAGMTSGSRVTIDTGRIGSECDGGRRSSPYRCKPRPHCRRPAEATVEYVRDGDGKVIRRRVCDINCRYGDLPGQ